jgi:hypothetical protein
VTVDGSEFVERGDSTHAYLLTLRGRKETEESIFGCEEGKRSDDAWKGEASEATRVFRVFGAPPDFLALAEIAWVPPLPPEPTPRMTRVRPATR